jgi:hypothetical protein
MICKECGWPLWSDESKRLGMHPECVGEDPPVDARDLEQQLDDALEGGDE